MAKKDLEIAGLALRALVTAAESPVTGELIKKQLFSDLELDGVFELDLRSDDVGPASLPVHPMSEGE
ncbi:MAG: hypothetical protein R3E66_01775 [bacterium]